MFTLRRHLFSLISRTSTHNLCTQEKGSLLANRTTRCDPWSRIKGLACHWIFIRSWDVNLIFTATTRCCLYYKLRWCSPYWQSYSSISANRKVGIIRNIFHKLNAHKFLMLYKVHVRPILEYSYSFYSLLYSPEVQFLLQKDYNFADLIWQRNFLESSFEETWY